MESFIGRVAQAFDLAGTNKIQAHMERSGLPETPTVSLFHFPWHNGLTVDMPTKTFARAYE